MQLIKNATIQIVGNRIQIGDWYYLLLQSGDVQVWHVNSEDGRKWYCDSMESAVEQTGAK